MTKSDWAFIAFNTITLMMAVVGLATQHPEPMSIALVLAMAAVLLNSGRILRRSRANERGQDSVRQLDSVDEMDIHRVLDIDQRLEALERAEARRLNELAAGGLLEIPDDSAAPTHDGRRTRQRV